MRIFIDIGLLSWPFVGILVFGHKFLESKANIIQTYDLFKENFLASLIGYFTYMPAASLFMHYIIPGVF